LIKIVSVAAQVLYWTFRDGIIHHLCPF